ncbi:hypothetical protein ACIQVU_07995 [Lysinibacillus sp. NPDC098008]|uniref:hypothetical protein n=1 Tax=Lysinibacillus sp. NPDC098008 TaxID=3364146 RepID=UPI00380296E6
MNYYLGPDRTVEIKLVARGGRVIEDRYIESLDYTGAYGEPQTCNIQLISHLDKFNYLKDPNFKGILNKRGEIIEISIVTKGSNPKEDFLMKGIVNAWGMTAETGDYTLVRVEMTDRNTDINSSIFRGADVSATGNIYDNAAELKSTQDRDLENLNNVLGKIKENDPSFNFNVGTPQLDLDYGTTDKPDGWGGSGNTPPQNNTTTPVYGDWELVLNGSRKLFETKNNSYTKMAMTKNGYLVVLNRYKDSTGTLTSFWGIRIIDMNERKEVTNQLGFGGKALDLKDSSDDVNIIGDLKADRAMVVAVGHWGRDAKMIMIDLEDKSIRQFKMKNQNGDEVNRIGYSDSVSSTSRYYFENNTLMYCYSINRVLFLDCWDLRGTTATYFYGKSFSTGDGWETFRYMVSGNYVYMNIYFVDRSVMGWHYYHQRYVFKYSDGLNMKEEDTSLVFKELLQGTKTEDGGMYLTNSDSIFNFGYSMAIRSGSYDIFDSLNLTIEKNIPVTRLYDVYTMSTAGQFFYSKGYVYFIPNYAEYGTDVNDRRKRGYNEIVRFRVKYKHDTVTENGGEAIKNWLDESNNPIYKDFENSSSTPSIPKTPNTPSYDDYFKDAYRDSEQVVPSFSNAGLTNGDLLKDLADSTGMQMHSVGNVLIFETPKVKPIPDFELSTSFSAEQIEHLKSATVYNSVKIIYGRGSKSGVVQVFRDENVYAGESASTYEQIRPEMDKAQADAYARSILKNGIKEELIFSYPYVPGLKPGHTVLLTSQRLLGGSYKGVCTSVTINISKGNGASATYTLTDYS